MIDWSAPVYRHGGLVALVPTGLWAPDSPRPFRGFVDLEDEERGWIYYNEDGTPFPGAPEISNQPAHDPRQQDLALPDAELDAMLHNPAWGAFA
jgi:hypothetical protein